MKIFDESDFAAQISDTGQSFANDYNDGINGKFGFFVGAYDSDADAYMLTATWMPGLEEDEEVEGQDGDYGPKQTMKFWLIPMTPDQAVHDGKHEKVSTDG